MTRPFFLLPSWRIAERPHRGKNVRRASAVAKIRAVAKRGVHHRSSIASGMYREVRSSTIARIHGEPINPTIIFISVIAT